MAEVVFVLGAGASVEAGAPMMLNFLDVAEDIWLRGNMQRDSGHFERVFRSIAALKSVHAQMTLDTNNLEHVFSAFEMGAMVGRLGSVTDPAELDATRKAMGRLIARTLQDTVRLPVAGRQVRPPPSYMSFVELLQKLTDSRTRPPSAISNAPAVITLNYDLALDYALHFLNVQHAYGVDEQSFGQGTVRLLKLHGSLNWGACGKCGKVVPWTLRDFFQGRNWDLSLRDPEEGSTTVSLNIADHLTGLTHCEQAVSDEPVVVPPTWNKGENQLLRNVWRHAARELSEARYIAFIGYSFPETDLYFRYLLGLGLAGDTRIRRIIILNPDESSAERLNSILSPALRSRVRFLKDAFHSRTIKDLQHFLDTKDREH